MHSLLRGAARKEERATRERTRRGRKYSRIVSPSNGYIFYNPFLLLSFCWIILSSSRTIEMLINWLNGLE